MKSKTAFLWLACLVSAAATLHHAPAVHAQSRAAADLSGAVDDRQGFGAMTPARLKAMVLAGKGGCYGPTSSPAAAASQVLLPLTRQGVDGTTDQVLNVGLSAGFRLFGTISGAMASSITATGSDGTKYPGQINPTTSSYVIPVKSDTYMVTVCERGDFTTTFNDPVAVTVTSDTQHDITLSPPTAWNVTLMVVGALPFGSTVSLASSDNSTGASATLSFAGTANLKAPDGTYSATLTQLSLSGAGTYTVVLGTVVVSGSDTTASFNVPATNTLSGAVSMMDGTSVPGNSLVLANDRTALQGTGCFPQALASGFGAIDSSSGAYQETLANGVTFNVTADLMTNPAPDVGLLLYNAGLVTMTGDTTMNIVVESQPPSVTFSGQVTDPDGNPVPNVTVTAVSSQVTGAPNSTFVRATTTDMNGMYRLVVENGSAYAVSFSPPAPMP